MLSESSYRYLLRIYELIGKEGSITPKRLGDEMHVQRPTAYEYIKKLEAAGILLKRNHEYSLTERGLRVAMEILRKHRVIETMLYRNGVDIDNACQLATKIQFEIDDVTVEKIYVNLGSPKCCPHGRPIPGDDNGH